MAVVLVVDSGAGLSARVAELSLVDAFVQARTFSQAEAKLARQHFDFIIAEISSDAEAGLDLIARIRTRDPQLRAVVICSHPNENALQRAIDLDVVALLRSAGGPELREAICRARAHCDLIRQGRAHAAGIELRSRYRHELIGESPAMVPVHRFISKFGHTKMPALIQGLTGSGKDVVANQLHMASRSGRPFHAVNCGALQVGTADSQLFGHKRGAFTSAERDAPGHFELAHTGTLFLDEIGHLPLDVQPKLLRALETGSIQRVGDGREIQVDVRVIAATSKALSELVAEGKFLPELMYRLAGCLVDIPSLADRREDILLLAAHFFSSGSLSRRVSFDEEASTFLREYAWPGNVRELRSLVDRLSATCAHDTITLEDLRGLLYFEAPKTSRRSSAASYKQRLREHEVAYRREALQRSSGNFSKAACLYGEPVATFSAACQRLGTIIHQKPSLLVVDDAVGVLKAMSRSLNKAYAITTARDGEEALALLMREDFDLVLCDIRMPRMDGVELLRKLEPLGRPKRFALMTAWQDQKAHVPGGVPVFEKPVSRAAIDGLLVKPARS